MSPTALLDRDVRTRGLHAMAVLAMAKSDTTSRLAHEMTIRDAAGESVKGVDAARDVLVDALEHDPSAWAEWLADELHANAAVSMLIALDDETVDGLRSNAANGALIEALDAQRAQRITRQLLSVEMAERSGEERVIDLTEQKSTSRA